MTKSTKTKVPITFEEFGRIPPQCLDIEESILGILLMDNKTINLVVNIIKPEYFYKEVHQIIYETIFELYSNSIGIDTLTVVNKLRDKNRIDEVGGPTYVSQLTHKVLSDTNIMHYCLTLIEKYILRSIIQINSASIKDCYENKNPFNIISYNNEKLTEFIDKCRILEQKDFSTNMSDTIENIIAVHTQEELLTKAYYPLNIKQLDPYALVSPNNTLLIGGKSGSGKTRFLIYFIRKLLSAHFDKISVKWYSMEDDKSKLVRCFLSPLVGLTDEQMEGKNYKLTEQEIHSIMSYKSLFSKYDIDIQEEARSIDDISVEYKAFAAKRKDRLNILIIDNLMLLNDNSSKDNQLKIDDNIARKIFNIRNSCHVNGIDSYIIALHHFTDEQQDMSSLKTAYRPREKHFKGSTRIRDASTQIMLLNRFANYPDILELYPDMKDELSKLMTIDITKNRNGSVGLLRAFADMDYTNFNLI